jgi:hypothetical protein
VIIANFPEDVEPIKDKTFPRYWGSMPSGIQLSPLIVKQHFQHISFTSASQNLKNPGSAMRPYLAFFCFKNPGDIHCRKRLSDVNGGGQLLSLKGTVA